MAKTKEQKAADAKAKKAADAAAVKEKKAADAKAAKAKQAQADEDHMNEEMVVVLTISLSGSNGSFIPGQEYPTTRREAYSLFNKDFCKLPSKAEEKAAKAIAKKQAEDAAAAEAARAKHLAKVEENILKQQKERRGK
jgi:membrane protein involved in colicin uptake